MESPYLTDFVCLFHYCPHHTETSFVCLTTFSKTSASETDLSYRFFLEILLHYQLLGGLFFPCFMWIGAEMYVPDV